MIDWIKEIATRGALLAPFTTADLATSSRALALRFVGLLLRVGSLGGHAEALDDQPSLVLRQPKAAQSVVHHAERQLTLAHQRQSDAVALEVGQFGVPVRPRHSIDTGIYSSSDLKNAPRLKCIRCGNHKEPGTLDIRRLKHAGRRGIAPDNRLTVRPEFLGATTISLHHNMGHALLSESLANRTRR